MKKSAGLAIICDRKVLIAHPTNNQWKGRQSIPKGAIEEGETPLDAAIRETKEEIGLSINESEIDKTEYICEYRNKKKKKYKQVHYFITSLSQKPIDFTYQIEEIDHADFYTFDQAKEIILPKQLSILVHLKEKNLID